MPMLGGTGLRARCAVVALSCALPAATVAGQAAPSPLGGRTSVRINDDWRYHADGINLDAQPSRPDASWERVTLPHTWNAADYLDDVPGYRRGVSWYRRRIPADSTWRGRRVHLRFEGVNQVADVYVNGFLAGRHEGGYTAFNLDVTRLVRTDGAANVVAVKVDNSHDPFIPPLSVGFALYGGIYRDAWLVVTDPVHVTMADLGGPGITVTTPTVSGDSGVVNVAGAVTNDGAAPVDVRVATSVMDAAGTEVASGSAPLRVDAGHTAAWQNALPPIRRPKLWSPDRPYLYTVRTEVMVDGVVRDRVSTPLGFRWTAWDAARGFLLNGERLQLRGTNRHQDYAGRGSALPDSLHERDMALIKAMGANFVRLAHYPQDPAVLDAADRLGLLVWEEIPVVNYITASPRFTARADTMVREMIRQHRNHPSVIMWGTMNEAFLWGPSGERVRQQDDTAYMRVVRDHAAHVDSVARAEDPTRVTAMAIHGSPDYDRSGVARVPQVLGVNIYDGWYSGVFAGFGANLDRRHARWPAQPIFVSEYGAEDDARVNSTSPERFDFSGTWMRRFHESYLAQVAARPWLSGAAVWSEFDFSQPETGGSIPYMNQKGLATFDRTPKDAYYLYQANWTTAPMVRIASRGWTHRAGIGHAPQDVDVYSNLPTVELRVNGRSLGAQAPNAQRRATWPVAFVSGENVMEARATDGAGARTDDRLTVHYTSHAARLADPATPFRELAVNVGGRAQMADVTGRVWLGDQDFAPGAFGAIGGVPAILDKDLPVTGTTDTPLYFTYRKGIEGYRLDVPDGEYDVELRFAEPDARPGERVFSVTVNGRPVVSRLDLAAVHGLARAATYQARARASNGHGLDFWFVAERGVSVLSAIRVRRR